MHLKRRVSRSFLFVVSHLQASDCRCATFAATRARVSTLNDDCRLAFAARPAGYAIKRLARSSGRRLQAMASVNALDDKLVARDCGGDVEARRTARARAPPPLSLDRCRKGVEAATAATSKHQQTRPHAFDERIVIARV